MRLIPYIRVSTEDQREHGHSLGQQHDRLLRYFAVHEFEAAPAIFDEGVSASIPLAKRPGGAKLLAELRAGRANGVAVIRLDRLFRNALDGLRFFEEEIEAVDARVHSVTESIDTSTPSGWLALIMQLATADFARRLDVVRATETNHALRAAGKVYGGVPFGCVAIGGECYFDDTKRKHRVRGAGLARDRALWTVREAIVDLRASGETLRAIAARLRADGHTPPRGGRNWSPSTLRGIIDTHDSLMHLPWSDDPAVVDAAVDVRVSRGATATLPTRRPAPDPRGPLAVAPRPFRRGLRDVN